MLSRAVKDMVWGTVKDDWMHKLYGEPSQDKRRNMSTETQQNFIKYIQDYQQGKQFKQTIRRGRPRSGLLIVPLRGLLIGPLRGPSSTTAFL